MADRLTNYQCPACTGPLRFDGASGRLVCDYCGSTYTTAEIEARYASKAASADKQAEKQAAKAEKPQSASAGAEWSEAEAKGLASYSCPSCGAELICESTAAASVCPYCGNPTVIGGQFAGKLKPEYVLPFKLDHDAAAAALKRFYKGKFLLPRAFTKDNRVEEIKGVYVPFWLYDAEGEGQGEYEGHRSESHREGDYIITTVDHFDVERRGTAKFKNIPVDASSSMQDNYMDAIEPFDYSGLVPFSPAYLPGFFADRYDKTAEDCSGRARKRVENTTAEALHATIEGYSDYVTHDEEVNVELLGAHYALMPVWLLSTKWKGKTFLFAMNGQTGRFIGDLPIDKGRVAALFAAVSLPLMALLAFLLLL